MRQAAPSTALGTTNAATGTGAVDVGAVSSGSVEGLALALGRGLNEVTEDGVGVAATGFGAGSRDPPVTHKMRPATTASDPIRREPTPAPPRVAPQQPDDPNDQNHTSEYDDAPAGAGWQEQEGHHNRD